MRILKTEIFNDDIEINFLEDGTMDLEIHSFMPMNKKEVNDLGQWLIDMANEDQT